MGSFALWFNSSSDSNEVNNLQTDVHFNLWNLHEKAEPTCLDIGIKANQIKPIDKINFFVPFDINKENIVDLGCFLKISKLLCAVFNDDYSVTQSATSKSLIVHDSSNEYIFNIYCLDITHDVTISNQYSGTVISIKIPNLIKESEKPIYFRFRIRSEKFSHIIKRYNPKNLMLQSAFSIVEAIDFRFNDYRSLEASLLEHIKENRKFNIEKVHFLLLTESEVDLIYSTPAAGRELEQNVWDEYYNCTRNKNIVAYHWKFKKEKQEKPIENCIMFVKTKVRKCNMATIIVYLLILGGLTVLFNYISSLLF